MSQSASSERIRRHFPAEIGVQPAGVAGASREPVKLEILVEDELEEENAPLNKRMKLPSISDQLIAGHDLLPVSLSQYNPLNEPSPLGLRLKKSPSLLELIQMRISQGNSSSKGSSLIENSYSGESSACVSASNTASSSIDRLKASNFPASLLRIGHWEYASRHEADLVAKFYYAKHKLVWEVLDGGLKSKIEIQWSDIVCLNVKMPEDGPATMTIVLAQKPLFFRETNPQPRKHTLWQPTSDFTDNQASIHRKHFVQVPVGVLNKHFEKLLCDPRLNFLSRQPEMVLNSPYFESFSPSFQDSKDQRIAINLPTFPDATSSSVLQTVKTEQVHLARNTNFSHEALSPSSVMDTSATEGSVSTEAESLASPQNWEQLIMQGLRPSMSMNDLVNHIGSCISGQGNLENPSSEFHEILNDIAQDLLGDSQVTCADEKSLMKRINSLGSLLHNDGMPLQLNTTNWGYGGSEDQKDSQPQDLSVSGCKPAMSRKDSYGDLLLNLPRIASLPKFLFHISEDG